MPSTAAVQRCLGWVFCACALIAAAAPRAAWGDDRILVAGMINDRPAQFTLDTGAGLPFVAVESKVEAFDLADRSPPPAAAEPMLDVVGVARAQSITLLGKTYADVIFHLIAAGAPNVLNEFDAIVGWPAVRGGVLHLDLGENIAAFEDTAPSPTTRGWQHLPVIPADVLVVQTGSEKKPFRVLIDTGLDDGVRLGAAEWSAWTDRHPGERHALDAAYGPGQGIIVRKQYLARRLKIGKLVLRNVMVSQASDLEQRIAGAQVDAVVGIAGLRSLNLYVDGAHGVAHVREAAKRAPRQAYNRLGAVFVPQAGDFSTLVATVAPGSPAAAAGVRNGDILIAVDDRPTADYLQQGVSFASLWHRPAGTRCGLVVRRGDQVVKKTVVLQDYLN